MTQNKSIVLMCTCGDTLKLDYQFMKTRLTQMPQVDSVEICRLLCQEEGLDKIRDAVHRAEGRVVIAACTSQKIRPRIEMALARHELNSSQIHYVNIREHSAWVHPDAEEATRKSVDMIRGAVKVSELSRSMETLTKKVPSHVTVIGGGIAGIESALSLEQLGYEVTLIELTERLGGHVIELPIVAPTGRSGAEILASRLNAISSSKKIHVRTKTRVKYIEGEMGNFTVYYESDNGVEDTMKTSAVVLAMGFKEFKPTALDEYRYGKNPDVITQLELSKMLSGGRLQRVSDGGPVKEIVMIQCVGSRAEDYKRDCSKLCCTFAIDNALEIIKKHPGTHVRIVYMDIRVPFENEEIYRESRQMGVDYIRGRVSMIWEQQGKTHLRFYDSLLNTYFESTPDLVVLSSAILPADGVSELAQSLGFAVEYDGHVKELYGKLRRNETRRRGVVAVGSVTRPQFVFESVVDAQAGALIIHNELQGGTIERMARGAILNTDDCVGCSLCAQQCPRGVPLMIEQKNAETTTKRTTENGDDKEEKILFKASIDTLNCHACGVCQSLCPSAATQLSFLTNEQLWGQIEATLEGAGQDYPITLCFYCEECAVSTIDIVGTMRYEYAANTRLIPVPCAGRVSVIDILKAFEHGASTVMIASCEKDRCHIGGTGNEIAQTQVDVAKDILSAIGWEPERVDMFRMFSAEPERFIKAVQEMVRRAKELGPTPVHVGTAGKWMEARS